MSSGPATLDGLSHDAGSGETAIRDPLYVFAVNDLAATMTDEVFDFAN